MGTALKQILLITGLLIVAALLVACVVGLTYLPEAFDQFMNGY